MGNVKRLKNSNVTDISAARGQKTFKPKSPAQSNAPIRKFVPFNGFDGQYLSGTGALVFEGELLNRAG